MCGIAGLIDWRASTSADGLRAVGEAMNETLRHRGPDGGGVWAEAETGVVLAHRRLAIIDVSPGGAQPMHSADARYVITFNGEIYNYRGIRDELAAAGRGMRGDSDTEVLLEACAFWGVEGAIERAVGMLRLRSGIVRRAYSRSGATDLVSSGSTMSRLRERLLFASQLRAFGAAPIGARRSTKMRSWAFCVTVISLSRTRSSARLESFRPVIFLRCGLGEGQN